MIDEMGNDIEYKKLLFKEFENIDGRHFTPLSEEKTINIPGKYKYGFLTYENKVPKKLKDIELHDDGKITPDDEKAEWSYYKENLVMTYWPYDAMPEYDAPAGVEEQGHYVFVENNGSSMIFTNSDGSVSYIFIES